MSESEKFRNEVQNRIEGLKADLDVQALSRIWLREITRHKYAYNLSLYSVSGMALSTSEKG